MYKSYIDSIGRRQKILRIIIKKFFTIEFKCVIMD